MEVFAPNKPPQSFSIRKTPKFPLQFCWLLTHEGVGPEKTSSKLWGPYFRRVFDTPSETHLFEAI